MPSGAPPAPTANPSLWWMGDEKGGAPAGPAPGRESPIPGEHWPSQDAVEYVTHLIVLVILLLALPWLLSTLLTAPHELSGRSAGLSMGAASIA